MPSKKNLPIPPNQPSLGNMPAPEMKGPKKDTTTLHPWHLGIRATRPAHPERSRRDSGVVGVHIPSP